MGNEEISTESISKEQKLNKRKRRKFNHKSQERYERALQGQIDPPSDYENLEDNERWSHQISWTKSSTTEMKEINKHKDRENVLHPGFNELDNINSKKAVPLKENYNDLDEPNNMKAIVSLK